MFVGKTCHIQLRLDRESCTGRDGDGRTACVRSSGKKSGSIVRTAGLETAGTRSPGLEGRGDGHCENDTDEHIQGQSPARQSYKHRWVSDNLEQACDEVRRIYVIHEDQEAGTI